MPVFNTIGGASVIPPADLDMMRLTLTVWCRQQGIRREEADVQAKALMTAYFAGKRSSIDMLDALIKTAPVH